MKVFLKSFIVGLFTLALFVGCNKDEDDTIKIGFVAGLSGKYSALGTSIRDGFTLAFDEINYKIGDKKVKIIQKDDKQDPKLAKKIIEEFMDKNIKLIIGNATSSMTAISIPIVNKYNDVLLFSATASGADFTEKDDNFIRIQVDHSAKRYTALNNYLNHKKYKNIFFIYDSKNISYAKGYLSFFQDMVNKAGGKFIAKVDMNDSYESILAKLKATEHDLILIVGNSVDTANMIQYLRLNNINNKVLASGWAKTMDFIENGGKAVEGTIFSTGYDENSKDKAFLEFVKKFKAKYGKQPSVFAAQGYELAKILIQNLRNSTDISTLKDRILKIGKYDGLQGDIEFDKYGDVSRKYFMMEIRDGKYVKVDY